MDCQIYQKIVKLNYFKVRLHLRFFMFVCMFSLNSLNSVTKIYVITLNELELATSCVRDRETVIYQIPSIC